MNTTEALENYHRASAEALRARAELAGTIPAALYTTAPDQAAIASALEAHRRALTAELQALAGLAAAVQADEGRQGELAR